MVKRITLEDCQKSAADRGGKCLSIEYISQKTKMLWRCSEGHEWSTSYSVINYSSGWCPTCAGKAKYTLEQCQKLAESKGGKCLSKEYINNNTKMLWECKHGHRWNARLTSLVSSDTWCSVCALEETRLTLEPCQKYAHTHNGKCLSTEYVNIQTKLLWECEHGHQFTKTFETMKRGSFCSICAKVEKKKLQLFELKMLAISRGGKCLSTEYIDRNKKLTWECEHGHRWDASPYAVVRSTWCPKCLNKTELKCRTIFENLLGKTFPNLRHEFIRNPKTGRKLELDGYCDELKLAFEYDGEYNYKPIVSEEKLEEQLYREQIKTKVCIDNGIVLIRIPYWKKNSLEEYIKSELNEKYYLTK